MYWLEGKAFLEVAALSRLGLVRHAGATAVTILPPYVA